MIPEDPRKYSVSQITDEIKRTLEPSFKNILVQGEISNFRPSSSGHLYFSLKDRDAVISAVMFKGRSRTLTFLPADGQEVEVFGSISVYEKRGAYQIICESMKKSGQGSILAVLEERKKRLAAEGLFDTARKKPIPRYPERVAVVTSPTGAAVRDIIRVLRTRKAPVNCVVLPAAVQGEDAASQIARQIKRAGEFSLGDVIIVTRGGGSLEDLLPFSEEIVVRAVAESDIPIISAVGHEIDTALCDYAADVQAPTPSAAAETVCADGRELETGIRTITASLISSVHRSMEKVKLLTKQFHPEELERTFRILLQPYLLRLDDAKEEIIQSLSDALREKRHNIELLKEKLLGNSPLEILKKGYAVIRSSDKKVPITSASMTETGDDLNIRFYTDELDARVTGVHPEKDQEKTYERF